METLRTSSAQLTPHIVLISQLKSRQKAHYNEFSYKSKYALIIFFTRVNLSKVINHIIIIIDKYNTYDDTYALVRYLVGRNWSKYEGE